MKKVLVFLSFILSGCSIFSSSSVKCDKMVGSWKSLNTWHAINIQKSNGAQYLVTFYQGQGFPFLSKCEDGIIKTGGWPGDAQYLDQVDHIFMTGFEFQRTGS